MINHENKFAYLGAGKTGSSTISSALRKIKGTEGAQHRTLLSVWNKPNNNIIPNNYFTFTFCRNPYSRLPSAWREFKKSGGFKWAKTEKYWNRDSFKLHGLSTKNVCEDFSISLKNAAIQFPYFNNLRFFDIRL